MHTANTAMYQFRVAYHNRQGTLMRILAIVTRRGLDLPYVRAERRGNFHVATFRVAVNPKQLGQLCREWSVTPDVIEVRQPTRVLEAWSAFARVQKAISRRRRSTATASPRQAWRAVLARLFALVPSR